MAFKFVKNPNSSTVDIIVPAAKTLPKTHSEDIPPYTKPEVLDLKVPVYHGGGKFGQVVEVEPPKPQPQVVEAAVDTTETMALVNEYIILDQKYTEFEGDKIAK